MTELSTPVSIISDGVVQETYGGEVNIIDFDKIETLTARQKVQYSAHALFALTIDSASDTAVDLIEAIETGLDEMSYQ